MATLDGIGTIAIESALEADAALKLAAVGPIPVLVLLEGIGQTTPKVISAIARTPTKIRVTFDQGMSNDSRLTSINNYALTPATDGVPLYVQSVTPETSPIPTYVDLVTNEMTDGQGYQVAVTTGPAGPVSAYGIELNAVNNTASFVGSGESPTLLRLEAVGPNRVDVVFSEPMLDNAAIRNVDKYVFSGGLTVSAVLDVVGDTVKLVTSDQTPGAYYVLTIGP